MADPYKILGVSRDASDEEIKKAESCRINGGNGKINEE